MTSPLTYHPPMEAPMPSQKPGTAFVNKGEPSATDMAHLRRHLTDSQKQQLRRILARRLRAFAPGEPHDGA